MMQPEELMAPLPSDSHASFVRISAGAGNYGLLGVSDFAMYADAQIRACLVGEVKNLNGKIYLNIR
jgi:hypothetical protein